LLEEYIFVGEKIEDTNKRKKRNMSTATASVPMENTSGTSSKRKDSRVSRDECLLQLGKGLSVAELSERCKELLGANSKIGVLARRNSSIAKTWNPNDGHNSRSYSEVTFGSPTDAPSQGKSIGEMFLEGKSPEHAEKIRSTIARTASRGAKVRTEELVTEDDVRKEAQKEQLQRRNSREKA
jgi:hypothetical protein